MAVKTINQKITLSGGDEIARSLRDLARLGEEAFRQLGQAAAKIDLNLPLEKVKAQLQDLARTGQQAFTQLGQSAQQAIAPINEVGNASQRAAQGVGQVGQSAAALGPVKEQASAAATAIGTIGTAIKTAAGLITGFAATIGGLTAGYIALADSATKAALSVQESAQKSGQSLANYQQLAFVLERLGLSPGQATEAIKKLQDQLNATTSGALRDFQRSLGDTQGQFIGFTRTAIGSGAIIDAQYSRIARGSVEAARALQQMALNGQGAFTNVQRMLVATGAAFDMTTGKVREGIEPWKALAEVIRNMPEDKARDFLGKFLPADIVNKLLPALREGSAGIERFLEEYRRLFTGFSEEDIKIAQAFQDEMKLLKRAIEANKNELGLLFAPVLTPIIRAWTESIRANRAEWLKLATALRDAVLPIITKVTEFLTKKTEGDVSGVDKIIKAFRELGVAIKPIYDNIIKPAFTEMGRLATLAATEISRAFGDEVTPTMVALGFALTFLLGPINAVSLALLALFGGDTPALNQFREKLRELGIDIDWVKQKFIDLKDFLRDVFKGEGPGFESFRQTLAVIGIDIDEIKAKFFEFFDDIRKLMAGKDKDVKNQWLVDLKNALKEFTKEIGPATVAGVGFFAWLVRIVGPANVARLAVLQMTGALEATRNVALIVAAAFSILVNGIGVLVLVGKGLVFLFGALARHPLILAVGLLAAAFLLLTNNADGLRAVLALLGIDLDKVNAAIDDYNKQSYAEAQRRSKQHYQDVSDDFRRLVQIFRDANKAIEDYNKQSYDEATRRSNAHYAAVRADFDAALTWIRERWDQFTGGLDLEKIKAAFTALGGAMAKPFVDAFETIKGQWDALLDYIVQKWEAFKKTIEQFGTSLIKPFTDAFATIRGQWDALLADIEARWTAFTTRVRNLRDMLPEWMRGGAADPLPPVSPEGQGSYQRLSDTVQQIADGVQLAGTKTTDLATQLGNAAAKAGELAAKMGEAAAKAGEAAAKIGEASQLAKDAGLGDMTPQRFVDKDLPEGQVEDRRGEHGDFQAMVEAASNAADLIAVIFEAMAAKISEHFDTLNYNAANELVDIATVAKFQAGHITRAFETLGQALIAPFNMAATGIIAILDQIKAKIDEVAAKLQQLGSGSGGGLGAGVAPGEGAGRLGGGLGGGLGGIGQQLIAGLEQAISQLQTMIGTAITNIGTAFSTLGTTLLQPFYTLLTGVDQVLLMVRGVITAAFEAIKAAFVGLEQAMLQPFYNLLSGVDQIMSMIRGVVDAGFGALSSSVASAGAAVQAAIAQIIASLRAAVAEAQALAAAAQQAADAAARASSSAGGSGFARGGYTGDVGTRRVAGVVHGGEYVEPAHVVRKPGVRAFLETLRRVGDLREAIRRFSRGFSVGGFVDNLSDRMSAAMMPGFASGGPVPVPATAGRDLGVLRLDAGGEMLKVMTDQSTAFKLQRFARRQQMTSGGRAPVWER